MGEQVSDALVGAMMTVFGMIGIVLAAGARDDEMTVFGYSLAGLAVCFVFGLVRRHYDEAEAAQHAVAAVAAE
jgi:energy-converting hydrogenase Eha subunit E